VFAGLFSVAAPADGVAGAQYRGHGCAGPDSVCFTYFLLDVYMKLCRRWRRSRIIATYYKERRSPDERLAAWQMYWRARFLTPERDLRRTQENAPSSG